MSGSWYSTDIQRAISRDKSREVHLRRSEALDRARRVAAMLKEEYGVSAVLLYGSLIEGGFDSKSDIDLMIDGFSGAFWRMYSDAGALAEPFPLSIVCREDATPSLVEHVALKGMEL